jgi:hypothetical protein
MPELCGLERYAIASPAFEYEVWVTPRRQRHARVLVPQRLRRSRYSSTENLSCLAEMGWDR